jgi:pyruvate,orthophosphate dikinase
MHYAQEQPQGLSVSLAQQMIAIAPARGKPSLSEAQEALLAGKSRWLYAAARADFAVIPTIAITRAAWDGLMAERAAGDTRLRAAWVAILFRLVGPDGVPPPLVVRTSAPRHSGGLMSARLAIPAPGSEADAVDPKKPLAQAVAEAFASYSAAHPIWGATGEDSDQERQIVIVQALATGALQQFYTRDVQSGRLRVTPISGAPPLVRADECLDLARLLDGVAGRHMCCVTAVEAAGLRLVSARPVQVSAAAELEAIVERVEQRAWSPRQAVEAFDPRRLALLLHPSLKADNGATPLATGLGVSPGAASGQIVFTAEDAARVHARGRHCILVVIETGPTDIDGMKAATGILTARGGMTSHAAVVARITGKPCVAAVRSLEVDLADMSCRIGGRIFRAGDRITIDGSDGSVFAGGLALSQPHLGGAIGKLLAWSDGSRMISVRTNVETVEAARTALSFGAEGIGLARSEHMFFSRERMVALRRLILSESERDRAEALDGLVDFQTGDYAALFSTMRGKPVTVRLFDPPLHEFLPRSEEDIVETAHSLGLDARALRLRLDRLAEVNPMLGHRGVRLAITYPEILDMQIRAVIAGARLAAEAQTEPVIIEVMVPFVTGKSEVTWIRDKVMDLLDRSRLLASNRVLFSFGTMIELPRAALRAGDIAGAVDFFSFGTNDLTQTTWGISRDDAPAFLAAYQRKGLVSADPFVTIDRRGVGEMIAIAIERGKAANPNLKIGICGEHAGDPDSLEFFATLPIDYVSCSPYRVPVARLALAQGRA